MEKRRFLRKLALCAGAFIALLAAMFLLTRHSPRYGHMCVSVVDVYTLAPLENATIVFPAHGVTAQTDSAGLAHIYNLPIEVDREHEKLLSQNFGQTTILCYHEGYHPYALFYAQVTPERVRNGPTLYMFPETESYGCVIEAPPAEWVNDLMERYRPQP